MKFASVAIVTVIGIIVFVGAFSSIRLSLQNHPNTEYLSPIAESINSSFKDATPSASASPAFSPGQNISADFGSLLKQNKNRLTML